jgi:hypothetical protein
MASIRFTIVGTSLQISVGQTNILYLPCLYIAAQSISLYEDIPSVVLFNTSQGNNFIVFEGNLSDCEDSTGTPFTIQTFLNFASLNFGTISVTTTPTAGSATSALQEVGNSSLSSINGKLPTQGQKTMPNSTPVVIASDQTSLPVTQISPTASGNITTQNLVPNGVATANSAVEIILNGTSTLAIQTTGTYTGALSIQVTIDNSRWETITAPSILNTITGVASATIVSGSIGVFQTDVSGFTRARVTGLSAMTGTATVNLRAVNSTALTAIENSLPTGTNTIGAVNIASAQTLATVTAITNLNGGQTPVSSPSTGNPIRIGGRVSPTTIATQDTTYVAGDASEIAVTTAMQQVTKEFAGAELDFNFNFSLVASTITVQQLIPASGTASIRNYITNLKLSTDTLGTGGVAWILDGALTVSSIAITTGLCTTSASHDLKIGDSVVFTALAGGTGVTANTVYFVTAVGSATTFNFALTIGGANVVPSVAYTGTTMYRILYQQHFRTTGISATISLDFPNPIRGNSNVQMNFLIPVTMTSGTIYVTSSGYRGF